MTSSTGVKPWLWALLALVLQLVQYVALLACLGAISWVFIREEFSLVQTIGLVATGLSAWFLMLDRYWHTMWSRRWLLRRLNSRTGAVLLNDKVRFGGHAIMVAVGVLLMVFG